LANVLHGEGVTVLPGRSKGYSLLVVYWYLHRFAGQWPFVRTSTEAALRERFPRVLCPLSGCRSLAQTS
jgi:hypothetical protein